MVAATLSLAQEIGRYWAELIQAEPAAERLWVRAARDYVELWLLAAPTVDDEIEMRLYEAANRVHDRFPHAYVRFHVLNPRHYRDGAVHSTVPADATEIALRPA